MSEKPTYTCTNGDCPIGCPPEHAGDVYEPDGFSCGTFRPCHKCGALDRSGHKIVGTGRFTRDGRHELMRVECPQVKP